MTTFEAEPRADNPHGPCAEFGLLNVLAGYNPEPHDTVLHGNLTDTGDGTTITCNTVEEIPWPSGQIVLMEEFDATPNVNGTQVITVIDLHTFTIEGGPLITGGSGLVIVHLPDTGVTAGVLNYEFFFHFFGQPNAEWKLHWVVNYHGLNHPEGMSDLYARIAWELNYDAPPGALAIPAIKPRVLTMTSSGIIIFDSDVDTQAEFKIPSIADLTIDVELILDLSDVVGNIDLYGMTVPRWSPKPCPIRFAISTLITSDDGDYLIEGTQELTGHFTNGTGVNQCPPATINVTSG